jgi:hypothetical protein
VYRPEHAADRDQLAFDAIADGDAPARSPQPSA